MTDPDQELVVFWDETAPPGVIWYTNPGAVLSFFLCYYYYYYIPRFLERDYGCCVCCMGLLAFNLFRGGVVVNFGWELE